jgi:hypothetical protein
MIDENTQEAVQLKHILHVVYEAYLATFQGAEKCWEFLLRGYSADSIPGNIPENTYLSIRLALLHTLHFSSALLACKEQPSEDGLEVEFSQNSMLMGIALAQSLSNTPEEIGGSDALLNAYRTIFSERMIKFIEKFVEFKKAPEEESSEILKEAFKILGSSYLLKNNADQPV